MRKLSIVKGASTGVDNEGNEISLLSQDKDFISAEDIVWEDERSIIKSIDKHLKKERKEEMKIKTGKVASDLTNMLWSDLTDENFEKHFTATYSKKYPELFENWFLKEHLFDEMSLSVLKSKKSTPGQIRDILSISKNS